MREATVCHLLRGSGADQEILLGRRSGELWKDVWNGPGGGIEPGETMWQGLKRAKTRGLGRSPSAS